MFALKKLFSSYFILLSLIILLGFILRSFRLSEIPVGFHIDEAQVGYNAYSLFKTGMDETGRLLPLHLKIWNFERPLAITYLSIPGVALFGLTEFGTRIDTALIGTISIILVFLLTQALFSNKKFSFLTAFLFTISPWHINLSRATSDAVVALFFYLLAFIFILYSYKKQSLLFLILAYLSFVLSFFSYYSTRLMIPIVFLFFFLFSLKEKRGMTVPFLVSLIIYLIFPFWFFWGTSTSRFNQVSIFHEQGTRLELEEQIREDGNSSPVLLTRAFHNKLVSFPTKIFENFSSYFTADFLILKGGLPIRYFIPNIGVIYFWELPFLLWGIVFIFSKKNLTNYSIALFWAALGVLSASLTVEETPNIQRALFVLPAFQWLTALGVLDLVDKVRNRIKFISIAGLIIVAAWSLFFFVHQYTVHTFLRQPWYRFYEMKEAVNYMNSASKQYKKVYLTFNSTEPYIFFLFYNKVSPVTYLQTVKEKGSDYAWNNMGNIEVSRRDCPLFNSREREDILVVYKVNCKFPKGSHIVKKFAFSDGAVSLIAVDFPKGFSEFYKELEYEEQMKTIQ